MSADILNLCSDFLRSRSMIPYALSALRIRTLLPYAMIAWAAPQAIQTVGKATSCILYHLAHSRDYTTSLAGRILSDETLTPCTINKKTLGAFLKYVFPISSVLGYAIYNKPNFYTINNQFENSLVNLSSPDSFQAPWEDNFKNVKNYRHIINDPFNADIENLLKEVIINPLNPGETITLRTKNHGEISYQIYKKIAGKGLVSYALKPQNAPNISPLIVFRGTEPDPFGEESFNSLRNDIEPSLGLSGWTSTKEEFETLLKDPNFRNSDEKIEVAGYSLGGAHAQYFIANNHENISRGIFFCNPSIDSQITEKFAKEIQNTTRETPLTFQIYRIIGDPVHHFGGKHLGCDVDHPNLNIQLIEVEIPNLMAFDVSLHWKNIFHTKAFDYIAHEFTTPDLLFKKLNNHVRDPFSSFIEGSRTKLSNSLHWIIDAFEYSFPNIHKFSKLFW